MKPSTLDAATGPALAMRSPSAPAPALCPFSRIIGVWFGS
jgi:hypothetical protein